MKIIVDTNVLISALVFDGRVLRLLKFLCESCYEVLVSEYVDSELRYNLFKKWPDKAEEIYASLVEPSQNLDRKYIPTYA